LNLELSLPHAFGVNKPWRNWLYMMPQMEPAVPAGLSRNNGGDRRLQRIERFQFIGKEIRKLLVRHFLSS
jgi:hypothetical protein